MNGSVTYAVVEKDKEELILEFLRAIRDRRKATFKAVRVDDPSSTPEACDFVVSILKVHNELPQAFELRLASANQPHADWFVLTLPEDESSIQFDIIT